MASVLDGDFVVMDQPELIAVDTETGEIQQAE
jgi:hypothetical protein